MKNIHCTDFCAFINPSLKHLLRVMRITAFLLCFSVLCVTAGNANSQNARVSIQRENVPLEEILNEIERQTDYLFVYTEMVDVKRKASVHTSNQPVSEVLNKLLSSSKVTYEMEGSHIILSSKAEEGSRAGALSVKQADDRITVSGRVVDGAGEGAIGATIVEKGVSNNGTVTDVNGNFSIKVRKGALLSITYIGYIPQEVRVNGTGTINIVLKEDAEILDEVVVIGYGSTSAKKMVAAVTSIKGEKLQDLPFSTVGSTLQGRASGVIVQQQGGEPGNAPKISIRGGGDPVYVIDGVVSSSWDFDTLNPMDIESLSVLKDAASLAVYGSRAADGIILIKTKEGRKGKTSISYSFNAQYSQPTVLPDKLDSYTYADLQNKTAVADGYSDYYIYSQEVMKAIEDQTDPYRYANTDWLKLGLKNLAPEYRHSLAMTGNSKNINYYLSLGMLDQGSLYTSDALNYRRYNLRSNVNTTFEEIGLTISLNISAAMEKKEYPSFSANTIWDHLFSRQPLAPAYNADGTLTSISDHPLMEMDKRSGYAKNNGKFINTQFIADWDLPWIQGASLGTMLHYRLNDSHVKNFSARAPQYNADGTLVQTAKPNLKEEAYFGESYSFELSASYLKTFLDKHSVDAKVVFTASENNGSNFGGSRKDYLSTAVDQLFAGSPEGQLNFGNSDEGGRLGLVGRLKYDYDSRYYIEGSFRYDGSDNFAPGYRWGFFPSIAIAWDITEEPFFKNLNAKWVNLLKLRGTYGQTGTESGVNRFGYLSVYNMNENAICIGGNLQSGFSEGALVSPTLLSWYTRNSLNYGFDFAFLNNKLKGTADYFFYVTKGGLMSPKADYKTPLGKDLPQIKSDSEHRREGVELSLRWSDRIGSDFSYEVGTNMTYFNNLWVKKADESLTDLMNPWKRQTHQTDYYGIGYLDGGLYQTADQILNSPRRSSSSETKRGDIVYQDVNGDGKIDGEDQVRIGMPTMPHFTYGIDFMFGYKGFALSGLFYGTGERYMEFGTHYQKGESSYVLDRAQMDFWTTDNPDAAFPRLSTSANINGSNNQAGSTFWKRNAAFLRLKNLSLTYDFKYSLLKRSKWLNMCKVNLTGTNLFTVSGVTDYFDPETTSTSGGYPVQRVYSFGVTVGF